LLAHLEAHHLRPTQLFGQGAEQGAGGVFCLLSPDDAHGAAACFDALPAGVTRGEDRGAVSLVGEGILDDGHVLPQTLATLAEVGVAVQGVSTSSFRVTALVAPEQVEEAVRALHARFISATHREPAENPASAA
jgi:hypothetical protein